MKEVQWRAKIIVWRQEHQKCNSQLRVGILQPEKVCAKERSYCFSAILYNCSKNRLEPDAQMCRAIEQEAKVRNCNKRNVHVRKNILTLVTHGQSNTVKGTKENSRTSSIGSIQNSAVQGCENLHLSWLYFEQQLVPETSRGCSNTLFCVPMILYNY